MAKVNESERRVEDDPNFNEEVLIYCNDDSDDVDKQKGEEMLDFLQQFTSLDTSDDGADVNALHETVASIIEILSLNLPIWDEEVEENCCTDESESDTSSSDEDDDDVSDVKVVSEVEGGIVIVDEDLGSQSEQTSEIADRFRVPEPPKQTFQSSPDEEEIVEVEVLKQAEGVTALGEGQLDENEEIQSHLDFQFQDKETTETNAQEFSDDLFDIDLSKIIITSVVSESKEVTEETAPPQKLSEGARKCIEEEELWASFLEKQKSGEGMEDDGSEDDDDILVEYSDTSEESDSDWSSDDDADNMRTESDQIATFPYMNSDSESEDVTKPEGILVTSPIVISEQDDIEIIFLDDDDEDDLVNNIKASEMTCSRCPLGKEKFTDQELFYLHFRRHYGQNHFVCPDCLKTFTRFSFCLSHEVRVHGTEFKFEHPRISEAKDFVKAKKEKDSLRELSSKRLHVEDCDIDGEFTDDLYEVIEEDDTDDEDPKFYPNYTVPSTTLYPYRGPKLKEMCECYEIQLKYGRKKPTGANTIAHVVLAHRQQLKDAGRIPDTGNRFWKEPVVVVAKNDFRAVEHYKKRESSSELYPKPSSSRKRRRSGSDSDLDEKQTKRRAAHRKRKTTTLQKSKILDRTFVSSLICRVCQLCNYVWKSDADLSIHRDEKHPTKKLLDLMTVPSATAIAEDDLFCTVMRPLLPLKRKRNLDGNTSVEKGPGASRLDMTKEAYLLSLGLISVKKLTLRKRRPRLAKAKVKPCVVKLERLSNSSIPRSGRVFLCDTCSYFSKSRDLTNLHKTKEGHGLKRLKAKRRLNKRKDGSGQLRIDNVDITSLVSSTSSHDYDELEDANWRISRAESTVSLPLRGSDLLTGPSRSSSSAASVVSASSFFYR